MILQKGNPSEDVEFLEENSRNGLYGLEVGNIYGQSVHSFRTRLPSESYHRHLQDAGFGIPHVFGVFLDTIDEKNVVCLDCRPVGINGNISFSPTNLNNVPIGIDGSSHGLLSYAQVGQNLHLH